jgi:hypothetical protein
MVKRQLPVNPIFGVPSLDAVARMTEEPTDRRDASLCVAFDNLADQVLAAMATDPFEVMGAMDFQAILAKVPKCRRRPWNQRDVTRCMRAAKAAGVEVRAIMPDGRVILGAPIPETPVQSFEDEWDKALGTAAVKIHSAN